MKENTKFIIIAALLILVISSVTSAQQYKWTKGPQLVDIIKKSPLYDSNKVWLNDSIPADTLASGKYIWLPISNLNHFHNSKIYTNYGKTIWLGQEPTTGLIVCISYDYGKSWELLYSEFLDPNFTQNNYNNNISANVRINQTFWLDSNKFVMPRRTDVFYSNLSDTNKIIKFNTSFLDDTLMYPDDVTAVGENGKIFSYAIRKENWQPYNSWDFILTSDDYGQNWDTTYFAKRGKGCYYIAIQPLQRNGDAWDNYNTLWLGKMNQYSDTNWCILTKRRGPSAPVYILNAPPINTHILPNIFQEKYDISNRDSVFYILGYELENENDVTHSYTYCFKFEKNNSPGGHQVIRLFDSLPTNGIVGNSGISFDTSGLYGVLDAPPISTTGEHKNGVVQFHITTDGGITWKEDCLCIDEFEYDSSADYTTCVAQTSSDKIAFMGIKYNTFWFGERINSANDFENVMNARVFLNTIGTTSTLVLELQDVGNLIITLNNLLGQEMMKIHDAFTNTRTFTKTFSFEGLPKGMYYLRVLYNGQQKVEKIIVY